jgi:Spy/CpxP family protein refolding chaperone
MRRGVVLFVLLGGSLFAQMPRSLTPWWNRPAIRRDLDLSNQQMRQIRMTLAQFRGRMLEVRAEADRADRDLEAEFARDPIDQARANQAIERVIAARGEVTRTISQLSLKLRTILTEEQWRKLQRGGPPPGDPER